MCGYWNRVATALPTEPSRHEQNTSDQKQCSIIVVQKQRFISWFPDLGAGGNAGTTYQHVSREPWSDQVTLAENFATGTLGLTNFAGGSRTVLSKISTSSAGSEGHISCGNPGSGPRILPFLYYYGNPWSVNLTIRTRGSQNSADFIIQISDDQNDLWEDRGDSI